MITIPINCLLSNEYINIFRALKDRDIILSSTLLKETTVFFRLQCEGIEFFMLNNDTIQSNGDEYPILDIVYNVDFPFEENFNINAKLLEVSLIRDEAIWEFNNKIWNLKIDIGIKFITDKMDIVCIAQDSVGGIMDFVYGDNIKIPSSKKDLEEQWAFKSDKFMKLNRKQIKII